METRKHILVVEDETKVARFIQMEFQHHNYLCSVEHTGGRALDRIGQEYFDLIILDLILPDLNGLILCQKIRCFSNVPILIVSAKDDIDTKVTLLQAGANDYLTKPFNSKELIARAESLLRSIYTPAHTENRLRLKDLSIHLDRHEVISGNQRITLTKLEFKLLAFLIRNKNIVLQRPTIFEEVWGEPYLGNTNSVDVCIRGIRNKIHDNENGKRKYIRTVRGVGYVAED